MLALASSAVVPLLFPARAFAATTLDDIVQRHVKARGGAAALDAVTSMDTTIDIEEGGNSLNARYRATTGNRMRIDVHVKGARVWSEGIDADGAWEGPPGKPEPSPPAGAAALQHGVIFNLIGLHRLPALGHSLSPDGEETVAGTRYHVIKVTLKDGFETFLYIDPATWMIARRRDVRALHPAADPTTKLLENFFEDFRPVSGVMTSFRSSQIDVKAGTVLQTTTVKSLTYNPALDEAVFARGYEPPPL